MRNRIRRNAPFRIFLFACLATLLSLAVLGVTACSSQSSEAEEQVQKNRIYMSQVNQLASTMSETLNTFAESFADENIVGMRQLVDEVGTIIADLEKLEAPSDALKAVHEDYLAGVAKLKDALSRHLDLYIESVADSAMGAAENSAGSADAGVENNAGSADAGNTDLADGNNSDTAGNNAGTASKSADKKKASDSSQYENEIEEIQKLYDEGMKLLEEADKKAAEIK